jgi:AcrR family transcriptional regulator
VVGIKKMAGDRAVAIGRPRNFDTDQALERALDVFWRKGYEGASICDLTAAMGINPPSLYAAFGNKEALFRQALDRYVEIQGAHIRKALVVPKARDAIAALLHGYARSLTDKSNPAGCLVVQGISGAGEHAQCIRDMLNAKRAAGEKDVRERLKRAKAEGELPEDADPAALARYFSTVSQGMAVQAASGTSRKELERVAEMALRAWPD